jgi:pimeloyl-ACP methyl ester carboxylesterase
VILAAGAISYRRFPSMVELAERLAKDFRVLSYDRRGRGDSTDASPTRVDADYPSKVGRRRGCSDRAASSR